MTDLRAIRAARGFALLIRPLSPVDKYPKPSRIMMARWLGQLELLPLAKPKLPALQFPLPLMGGWGLVGRPEVEKPAE
jgi:hypothetical protein